MAREFQFQDPGEGIHEAEVLEVRVAPGDRLEEGDVVLEIETDKATMEIPSRFAGDVEEVLVEEGQVIRVGETIMTYAAGDGEAAPADGDDGSAAAGGEAEPRGSTEPADGREDGDGAAAVGELPGEEVGGDGPEAGEARAAGDGEVVHDDDRPVPAAPSTRRLARELGVHLRRVPGSGPGGRVLADDVRAAAEEGPAAEAREETREAAPRRDVGLVPPLLPEEDLTEVPDFDRWGPTRREEVRSVRRATAQRMARAWARVPHAVHRDVADVTALERFRRRHGERVEAEGGKLTLTVFALKAVVAALKEFPRFNASLDPAAGEVVYKEYFHLGVAVDTDRGLIVPVIRDVDRKSLAELAVELSEIAERTRSGDVELSELRGGSFTVTNPGAIGGTDVTPVVNHPEVAILGMARARLEPTVVGGLDDHDTEVRLRLPLTLSFDHRVNDGADAARFMNRLTGLLSDPGRLTLGI